MLYCGTNVVYYLSLEDTIVIIRIKEKNINNENRMVKELNSETNLLENYCPYNKKQKKSPNNYFNLIIKVKKIVLPSKFSL